MPSRVLRHHAPGADQGIAADGDARRIDRAAAGPHVAADADRPPIDSPAFCCAGSRGWPTHEGRLWVCAVIRRRFPVGASPTRQPLQPEAIGAVMEVMKWLKPSISVSRIGDSASVQAATRVNAEQALYGAFSVNADFDRAPVIFLVGQQNGPRGACHRARSIAPQPCIR